MRASIVLTILCLISFSYCVEEEEFPIENDITVLTEATFDKAIQKYEHILVMFYAPWCGHCKKFKPELEKAAKILRQENLIVAKVDATVEKNLAQKYGVRGYPTVKFFKKGVAMDYTGGRKESEVLNWVRKKSGPAFVSIQTFEELEKLKADSPVCVIYYGTNEDEKKIFAEVAMKNDDYPFAVVESKEITDQAKEKVGFVVLYKKFDEKRDELSGFKEKDLADFVTIKSQKRVSTFDDKTTQIVFGDNQPTICYFGVKGEKWDEAEKLLDKIADKAMEKKLKVTMTEIKDGMGKRIAEYIGVKDADLPSIRIIDTRKEMKKYIMEKEINEENILEFIDGWEKGILKRHLKTQEEPKENKGPILEVVGKTFKRDVLENDKDVMIVFYAPWCGHCKKLLPEYEKAANKLKEKNPKVLLAKMDATENEVEGIEVTGFPTIKFYPGNKKDARPKDYSGDRTMDGIIKYLKTNCVNKLVLDEEETDKKDEKDGKTADL